MTEKKEYSLQVRIYRYLILSAIMSIVYFSVITGLRLFLNRSEPIWQIALVTIIAGFCLAFLIDRPDIKVHIEKR